MHNCDGDRTNTIKQLRMIAEDIEKGYGGFNYLIGVDLDSPYYINLIENSKVNKDAIQLENKSDPIECIRPLTYEEAQKLLYQGYIVRNEEFEYKVEGQDIFCREIGATVWNTLYRIGEYEKKMKWEIQIGGIDYGTR